MRVREGSKLCIPNYLKMLEYLNQLLTVQVEGVVLVKPSVIPVTVRGIIKHVAAPPLSLICKDIVGNLPCARLFTVADDCWVEGKEKPSTSVIKLLDSSFMKELQNVKHGPKQVRECLIIGNKLSINDYVSDYMNLKHIVILPRLKNAKATQIEGRINYLWSAHPILYGIREGCKVKLSVVTELPDKLKVLSKPLLYVDNEVIIAEIPFNNSVVFLGFNEGEPLINELLLRSIIYAC